MNNTVVRIFGNISGRDDIIENFDWSVILCRTMIFDSRAMKFKSYPFILNKNNGTFAYYIDEKQVANISARKKSISIHPLLTPDRKKRLKKDLESAVQDVYFLNNTVDFNDDCTEFVVSVFGQIFHKQTDSDIKKKDIVYVKIDSGLIFKIDRNNLAGYRFNPQKKEWNYDGPSFCEYEYGELRGKIIHFDDHYPVGEAYVYRSAQNGSPNKNKAENI